MRAGEGEGSQKVSLRERSQTMVERLADKEKKKKVGTEKRRVEHRTKKKKGKSQAWYLSQVGRVAPPTKKGTRDLDRSIKHNVRESTSIKRRKLFW